MNKLRIRTFSVMALLLMLLLPWLFFLAARLLDTGSLTLGSGRSDTSDHPYQILAAFAGLVLAFFIVGTAMRRYFIKPLEAMSEAACRIAAGYDDVRLPRTGIKEIAEVSNAFGKMVEGLAVSNRKRREAEEERRFVLAAIAHDLRTPLFSLRGYLDGLAQGIAQTPDRVAKYVDVCKAKSAQLAHLVEELFTFAKLEYIEDQRGGDPVDLRSILRGSMDSVSPLAIDKRIAIESNFPDEPCVVNGDAHTLERAFMNVLDNAVRHTPSDGRIVVRCAMEERGVTFTVSDTGTGFGPEELARAFEPLYRGEQSRNRSTGGAGLGLTIAQRIVVRHGGEITVSNDPADGGAIVSGWLPSSASTDSG